MKAILCTDWCHYRDLTVTEIPRPSAGPGQVVIAVRYATVGLGQTLIVSGRYQRKPPLPFVPGTEVAGVVTGIGEDVTGFAVGDRVVAAVDWGGYAEAAVATASTTWKVPDGVELSTAVSVPLGYGTSYAALHWRARIKPGDTVLVFGAAGGVGSTAVQLARLAGATVIAVASTVERVDQALAGGAHHGFTSDTDDLGKRVKALNGGHGADIVFDPVGGASFDQGLKAVAPEGRILVIGFASGDVPQIPANILLVKNAEVLGFYFGLYIGWDLTDERERHAPRLREMMDTLFGHVSRGELRPSTSTRYPLDRFVDAFDDVVGRRSLGRAVLEIGRAEAV